MGQWRTTTPNRVGGRLFVSGLRLSGIDAPMLIDGESLLAGACPREGGGPRGAGPDTLRGRHRDHGQSLQPQKRGRVRRHEAAGAELRFFRPYSPDFNPIDNGFPKLKALLRKVAARTRDVV